MQRRATIALIPRSQIWRRVRAVRAPLRPSHRIIPTLAVLLNVCRAGKPLPLSRRLLSSALGASGRLSSVATKRMRRQQSQERSDSLLAFHSTQCRCGRGAEGEDEQRCGRGAAADVPEIAPQLSCRSEQSVRAPHAAINSPS